MSEAEKKVRRDVRVDHLGLVGELQKRFADDLKTKVKSDLMRLELDRAAGDSFEALLVTGTTQTVDAEKFLGLFEAGAITREKFLAAISVKRDAALDCLSGDALAAISTSAPSSPSLRVSRIKGVEIKLVDAVAKIAAAIA